MSGEEAATGVSGAGAADSGAAGSDLERLGRMLGGPETAWLVQRVRQRLERGRPLTGSVTLSEASDEQRRAVRQLLRRPPSPGASLTVSLERVDEVLRDSGACPDGLAAAVQMLTGPVRDRAAEEAAEADAWRSAFGELDAVVERRPELVPWRDGLRSSGLVKRLAPDPAQARELLAAVARVVVRIPSPDVPIGRLAAEACGDAHALDEGNPIGTVALSAARALASGSDDAPRSDDAVGPDDVVGPSAAEATTGGEARRAIWTAVGVHLDDLSSTVLSVGLHGDASSALGRQLAIAREAGEACVLTLRQLRRHPDPLRGVDLVRICENPVVVSAAAEELGSGCAPLVCVNGRPSVAVWRLLELLASGGATFAYHGDFDVGGIAIASGVYERIGWTPWRFDAAAYEAASGGGTLAGDPGPTPWDPALATAMARRNTRVEEELVLDDLLSDLAG